MFLAPNGTAKAVPSLLANAYRKHFSRVAVDEPEGLAAQGLNELSGKLLGFIGTFENGFERGRLIRLGDQEHHLSSVISGGGGQRDALCVKLTDPIVDDDAARFAQRLGARKEREGVALVAHAEQQQVEAGILAVLQVEIITQGLLVFERGIFRV